MNKKTIDDYNFKSKRVFLRCDFNVPLDDKGNITNDFRIINSLTTIKKLIKEKAKLIIASHLGRPNKDNKHKLSLLPVAKHLAKKLSQEVLFVNDSIGTEVEQKVSQLKESEILLLENVRFHPQETSKDENIIKEFSKNYLKLADVFVNDAFGSSHRGHASVVGFYNHTECLSGYLVEKELEYFSKVLNNNDNNVVAIIGGAKVSDKILLIDNMLQKVDKIIIGGAMAYTFQYALGRNVGDSLLEKDRVDTVLKILKKAKELQKEIILPIDTLICDDFSNNATTKEIDVKDDIPTGWEGVDIGMQSVTVFKKVLDTAKTVIWNGPVGVFEIEKFSKGTHMLAKIIADLNATTVIGGGDTASAIYKFNLQDKMSHISTGGGSSLELLEGKILPGIDCLDNKV